MKRDEYLKHAAIERAFSSVRDVSQTLAQVENDLREIRRQDPRLFARAASCADSARGLLDELRLHPLRDVGDV